MLVNVIENYISSLSEREFDAPFIALLRLRSFYDIHFLHGSFEFGKDFIAKRVEGGHCRQYVFQTKAGNISLSIWNEARGQIDMMRTDAVSHPNFDTSLPRVARFVTTGRLVGGAPAAAQSYKNHLLLLNELTFEVWDREILVEMLNDVPVAFSVSSPDFLKVLGSIGKELNLNLLEVYSRNWIRESSGGSLRDVLQLSLIAHHCRIQGRLDLSCYLALMLLRSILATNHQRLSAPDDELSAYSAARNIFNHYACILWDICRDRFLEPDSIFNNGIPATLVDYPVRCSIILEILGLYGLMELDDYIMPKELEISQYLASFIEANKGTAHPLSDRWGVSLIPSTLLLARHGFMNTITKQLTNCISWIADRYENEGLGLASYYADPEEEVRRALGTCFTYIKDELRKESYLATIILDLCAVLQLGELYDLARNEFLAVGIILPFTFTDDSRARYCKHLPGVILEANMPYVETWASAQNFAVAPHHSPRSLPLVGAKEAWDELVISCVTRDRHSISSLRAIAVVSTGLR